MPADVSRLHLLQKLNEQLRQVNQQLRQQARVGTLYAPGLSYAPSHTVAASAVVTVPPEATGENASRHGILGAVCLEPIIAMRRESAAPAERSCVCWEREHHVRRARPARVTLAA